MPKVLAFARRAASVRLVSLAIFFTGVRALECARNSFSSVLVYSRRTRVLTFFATRHSYFREAPFYHRSLLRQSPGIETFPAQIQRRWLRLQPRPSSF